MQPNRSAVVSGQALRGDRIERDIAVYRLLETGEGEIAQAHWTQGYSLKPRCMATMPPVRLCTSQRSKPASSIIPLRVSWSGCMRIDSAR